MYGRWEKGRGRRGGALCSKGFRSDGGETGVAERVCFVQQVVSVSSWFFCQVVKYCPPAALLLAPAVMPRFCCGRSGGGHLVQQVGSVSC